MRRVPVAGAQVFVLALVSAPAFGQGASCSLGPPPGGYQQQSSLSAAAQQPLWSSPYASSPSNASEPPNQPLTGSLTDPTIATMLAAGATLAANSGGNGGSLLSGGGGGQGGGNTNVTTVPPGSTFSDNFASLDTNKWGFNYPWGGLRIRVKSGHKACSKGSGCGLSGSGTSPMSSA